MFNLSSPDVVTRISWAAGVLSICALLTGLNAGPTSANARVAGPQTIGLVLSGFDYQYYTTKDTKEECPDGLVSTSKENWMAQFPTRESRVAQMDRCGTVDRRGPECESVLATPELVRDPLP